MARKSRYTEQNISPSFEQNACLGGLYIRLSVEDEDNIEQNSIGNQKKIALHYLKEISDVMLVKTYTDNGYTGMNFKRPGFDQMMEDLESGIINCVIVKDISRLGRNFLQTSEYVEKIFPDMGVRLISINDGFDSSGENSDTSQLMLPIKMVMNDSYVRDISKKIRSSITSKMNTGDYLPPVGSIAYGYLRNEKENTFDIDPETSVIVQRIYEMRAKGMKFNSIARILNSEGVPSPGRIRYLRGVTVNSRFENAEWVRKTIRKICNDEVYLGNRVHGRMKRDKLGERKYRRPEAEWLVIEKTHQPIISEELYARVQVVNEQERELEAAKKIRLDAEFDYRGILRDKVICGDCRIKMIAQKGCARMNAKKGSRLFYECRQYINSQHRRCSSHYIRQEVLIDSVKKLLDSQVNVAENLRQLLKEVKQECKVTNYEVNIQNRLRSVKKKRENLEGKIEHMLMDLMEGIIDRDMYEYAKKQYSEEIDQLLLQENELSVQIGEFKNRFTVAENWVTTIEKYKKIPEINREIMDELIDYIEVFSNNEIKVHLNYCDPYKNMTDFIGQIPEVVKNVG